MSFQRETEVDGLEVYEFAGEVPETIRAEQAVPGELVGAAGTLSIFVSEVYTNQRSILVEPRTGSIVSTTSSPRRMWRPADIGESTAVETVIFEADLQATDETVSELVADAEDAKSRLDLLGRILPIVLGLLGLALLVVGLVLLARRDRGTAPAGTRRRARTDARTDDGIDVVRG